MEITKPKAQIGITIGIKSINLLKYESTSRIQELKKQLSNDAYEFQFDMNWNVVESEKIFNSTMSVILYEKQSSETKVELVSMKVLISFNLINFEEFIKKEKGHTLIPDQLIILTAGVLVSTARGMLALKLEESIINNAIIPLINPEVFLPKEH